MNEFPKQNPETTCQKCGFDMGSAKGCNFCAAKKRRRLAQAFKLTREQREAFLTGKRPPVTFPGSEECPAKKGDRYWFSQLYWIEVKEIVRNAAGDHALMYDLVDLRPKGKFLKRVPSISEGNFARIRTNFDEYGYPDAPTPAAIEKAGKESAYTSGLHGVVEDAGEAVDDETQAGFTKIAHLEQDQRLHLAQLTRERYELDQRLQRAREEAKIRGVDISSPERVIERQLLIIERRVFEGKKAA